MFEQIEEFNDTIAERRASPDPAVRASVKYRRPISITTMHNIRATLRHALNMAMRQDRLIGFNPAAILEMPPKTRPKPLVWTEDRVHTWQADFREYRRTEKQRRSGRRVDPIDAYTSVPRPSPVMLWTPAQTRLFLEEAQRHRLFALYRLIALRGLRRGEACGLRWKEVAWTAKPSRSTGSWYSWRGRYTKAPRRQRRPYAPSPWTPKPFRYCARTGSGNVRSASPQGRHGRTADSSSPSPTATDFTPSTSLTSSSGSPTGPACHRSACTTCAMAPHRSRPGWR